MDFIRSIGKRQDRSITAGQRETTCESCSFDMCLLQVSDALAIPNKDRPDRKIRLWTQRRAKHTCDGHAISIYAYLAHDWLFDQSKWRPEQCTSTKVLVLSLARACFCCFLDEIYQIGIPCNRIKSPQVMSIGQEKVIQARAA